MRRLVFLGLLAISFFAIRAHASPIDYIFGGIGTGTLNGVMVFGDSDFKLTIHSDTTTVNGIGSNILINAGVGTFSAGSSFATLTGSNDRVILDQTTPAFVEFVTSKSYAL